MKDYVADVVARLLLQQRRHSLPIDPRKLQYQQNITFSTFAEYSTKTRQRRQDFDRNFISKDGVTFIISQGIRGKRYLVLYNEQTTSSARIRFTLAHEIGHICLNHHNDNTPLEKQADQFAAELLMPRILVNEMKFLTPSLREDELSRCFGVSIVTVRRRLKEVKNNENYSTAELTLLHRYSKLLKNIT